MTTQQLRIRIARRLDALVDSGALLSHEACTMLRNAFKAAREARLAMKGGSDA